MNKRIKQILFYSDSEPNEMLIGMCHMICLPAALIVEFHNPDLLLILLAIFSGIYQFYAVYINCLKHRYYAVQFATTIAFATCYSLYSYGLLKGSRLGWCIIFVFAMWNTFRVMTEKISRGL